MVLVVLLIEDADDDRIDDNDSPDGERRGEGGRLSSGVVVPLPLPLRLTLGRRDF